MKADRDNMLDELNKKLKKLNPHYLAVGPIDKKLHVIYTSSVIGAEILVVDYRENDPLKMIKPTISTNCVDLFKIIGVVIDFIKGNKKEENLK